MEIERDVFKAIADPTRRAIINMIAKKPLTLNSVAENFDMTRQAVSLHVKILTECELIVITQRGRQRYCEAKLDSLAQVSEWVDQCRNIWENQIDSLENYLAKIQKSKRHAKGKK